jgi:signal transduction histidine kinase
MVIDLNLKRVQESGTLNKAAFKSIERVDFAIKRLKSMLHQVKTMSVIEEGKQIIDLDFFSTENIISDCKNIFSEQIDKKNITMEYANNTKEGVQLFSNESLITNDIVSNFIANAIKFTKEDGNISLVISGDLNIIKIEITDSGSGMSQENIDSIYGNSKRTELGTNGEHGTGLGLSIALFYIDRLNATIEIESRLEKDYPQNPGTKIILKFKNKASLELPKKAA